MIKSMVHNPEQAPAPTGDHQPLDVPRSPLLWLLDRFAESRETAAFIHEGVPTTYGAVIDAIRNFQELLTLEKVEKGETVVIYADYSPDVFCFMLALALNGNVLIPLTRDSVVEQSAALAVSGCDWIAAFQRGSSQPEIHRHVVQASNPLLTDLLSRDRPGLVLFSSGSTGTPKAILHDFIVTAEKFRVARPPVTAISFLMIDHFGGINTLLAVTSGLGTIVTVADRSVETICKAIESYKVELLPATPSFLTMLLSSGVYKNYDLSSLKRITYGTEVMPQPTLDRLRDAFHGVQLQQTYGLSEVGVLRSKSRDDGSLWVRLGGEGFETKVVDGILWVRSDFAMVGYLNAPSQFDEDGWFDTQDKVEVDGDFFRILGRTTDIINVGGQKVYPTEVEDVILAMDNVLDAAVYAEPHTLLGQMVVARVLLEEEESTHSIKNRVRAHCRGKLSAYKVPVKVVVSDEPLYTGRQKKIRRKLDSKD